MSDITAERRFTISEDHKMTDQFGNAAVAILTNSGSRYRLAPEPQADLAETYIVPSMFLRGGAKHGYLNGYGFKKAGHADGSDLTTSAVRTIEMEDGAKVTITQIDMAGNRAVPVGVTNG